MADQIVIKVTLDTSDINRAGQEVTRKLTNALDTGVAAAREAGRRIGQAMSAGIEGATISDTGAYRLI